MSSPTAKKLIDEGMRQEIERTYCADADESVIDTNRVHERMREVARFTVAAKIRARRTQEITEVKLPEREAFVNQFGVAVPSLKASVHFFGESVSWSRVNDLKDEMTSLCMLMGLLHGRQHAPKMERWKLRRVLSRVVLNFSTTSSAMILGGDASDAELRAMILERTAEKYAK